MAVGIGGNTKQHILEMLLKVDQYKTELAELAKLTRTKAKEDRDAATVMKELERQTTAVEKKTYSLSTALKDFAASQAIAVTKGMLLGNAISAVTGMIGEAGAATAAYSKASNTFRGDIDKLRAATGGLASDLDLMMAQNKLSVLGVKMSNDEYAELFRNTKALAGAMGRDLSEALGDVATMLARKSVAVADNIGIVMSAEVANDKYAASVGKITSQLTDEEKAIAFRTEAMAQMKAKAQELPPVLSSISDEYAKQKISISNLITETLSIINTQTHLTDTFRIVTGQLDNYGEAIEERMRKQTIAATKDLKSLNKEIDAMGAGLIAFDKHAKALEIVERTVKGGGGGEGTFAAMRTATAEARKQAGYSGGIKPSESRRATGGRKKKGETVLPDLGDIIGAENISIDKQAGPDVSGAGSSLRESQAKFKAWKKEKDILDQRLAYYDRQWDAIVKQDKITKEISATEKAYYEQMSTVGVDSLAGLTQGLVESAAAAIVSGASFGEGMSKVLKSVLSGIATQSLVWMSFEIAQALKDAAMLNFGGAGAHFTSAAKFGATAAIAGIVSAGVGGGSNASSGRMAGGNTAGAVDTARRAESSRDNKKTFSKKVEKEQPLQVNVYLGDPKDPGVALLMTKQISAAIKKAA